MLGNYIPWEIKIDAFPERSTLENKLSFLIQFAILAPSSHNSQPWAFKIEGDKILVFANYSRRLPASDKNDRQLFISLGCAITNIRIAAESFNFAVSIQRTAEINKELAAIITCREKSITHEQEGLVRAILTRANNRGPYEEKPLPEKFVNDIKECAPEKLRFDCVSDSDKKRVLAETTIRAGIEAMSDHAFRKELNRYVKSNITRSSFGMPGFGMGIPTPISLIAPTMIKFLNMNKLTAKKDFEILTAHTPAIGIISTSEDNPMGWLKTGEYFQEIALRAEKEGIRIGVWAAAIQIADHYKDIRRVIGVQERPQVLFRMGYTNRVTKHSPRFKAEKVLRND